MEDVGGSSELLAHNKLTSSMFSIFNELKETLTQCNVDVMSAETGDHLKCEFMSELQMN